MLSRVLKVWEQNCGFCFLLVPGSRPSAFSPESSQPSHLLALWVLEEKGRKEGHPIVSAETGTPIKLLFALGHQKIKKRAEKKNGKW